MKKNAFLFIVMILAVAAVILSSVAFVSKGKDGKDGINGMQGISGENGKDGLPGADGEDGKPGADGHGQDGLPGTDGQQGAAGWTYLPAADVFEDYAGGTRAFTAGGVSLNIHIENPFEVGWSAKWFVPQEKIEAVKFNAAATLAEGEFFIFIISFADGDGDYAGEANVGVGMKNGQLYIDARGGGLYNWNNADWSLDEIAKGTAVDSFNGFEFVFSADLQSVTIKAAGQTFLLDGFTAAYIDSLWMIGTVGSVDLTYLRMR